MATDYRRRARAKNNTSVPPWAWFVAGLLPGLIIAAWVWQQGGRSPVPVDETVIVEVDPHADIEPPPEPEYEFFAILPKDEVVVPAAAPRRHERADSTPPSDTATPPKERYRLQAGSFRTLKQADRMKAQLALLGLMAHIDRVRLDNGHTWHRVRLGPYTSRGAAEGVQKQLRGQGISAMLSRERRG